MVHLKKKCKKKKKKPSYKEKVMPNNSIRRARGGEKVGRIQLFSGWGNKDKAQEKVRF